MKKVHLAPVAIVALVLLPVLYGLWRIDVIPGVWDLQHWGQDVGAMARAERQAHRAERMARFTAAEAGIVERLDANAQLDLPGPVVLLGSSTLERFDAEAAYPGAWVLNRGIGDEPAGLLAERLERSLPPEAWPRCEAFVLYLGSVDLRRLDAGPEGVVQRATRVLDDLDGLAPGAPRLLLGLLPERGLEAARRNELDLTNTLLAELAAARPDVTFLQTDRAPIRDAGGELSLEHSADRLHLNALGYQVLASWIRLEGGPTASLLVP